MWSRSAISNFSQLAVFASLLDTRTAVRSRSAISNFSQLVVFIARLFSLIHFSIVRRWTARFLARGPFKDDDGGSLGGSARLLDTRTAMWSRSAISNFSQLAVFIARLFSLIHFSIVRRWTARFLARGPFRDDDGGSLGGSARLLDTRVLCTDILVG